MRRTRRLVVVGGDAAGMSAAAAARRRDAGLEIVVLERGGAVSFAACGIPYLVGGVVPSPNHLLVRGLREFAERNIEVRLRSEVVALDPSRRTVRVTDLDGGREREEGYDELVLATGASAVRPDVPGIDAPNVFTVRHHDDGVRLRAFVDEHHPRRITLVGAGYVGMEFSESFAARGAEVTVVEMLPQVFTSLDPDVAKLVEEELVAHGVVVRTGEPLAGLELDGAGLARRAATASEAWETDLVLVGGGVRPNVGLARDGGVPLDEAGAVATDDRMHTPVAGVWAAGDCTSARHLVTGRRAYVPLGPAANKQGRVVGENVAGGQARFDGMVGTALAKVFDLEVARTGLTETECAGERLDATAATVQTSDRADYFPGARPLAVKLVGERRTGRLLGGQLVGAGAAGRVNVVAAALHSRMTVDALSRLDLAYAPPFAPVWDPLLLAARSLAKLV